MRDKIIKSIYRSIDEINHQFEDVKNKLDKSETTVLYGDNLSSGKNKLDSLGLINFIVAVEQNIEDEFNIPITLADERAMSQENSPFKDVISLVEYIEKLINENLDDQ